MAVMPSGQLTDYQKLSAAIHDSIPSHLPLPSFLLDSAFDYSMHQVSYGGESFSTHHRAGDFCRNSNACARHFFILTGQQLILLFHQHFVG